MTDSSPNTRTLAQPSSGKIISSTPAQTTRPSQQLTLSDEIPFVPAYDLVSEDAGSAKTSGLSELEIALIGTTLWHSHYPNTCALTGENKPASAWLMSARIAGISQRL
jgi:hypothetical protein